MLMCKMGLSVSQNLLSFEMRLYVEIGPFAEVNSQSFWLRVSVESDVCKSY